MNCQAGAGLYAGKPSRLPADHSELSAFFQSYPVDPGQSQLWRLLAPLTPALCLLLCKSQGGSRTENGYFQEFFQKFPTSFELFHGL